jgi:hypothetical protein
MKHEPHVALRYEAGDQLRISYRLLRGPNNQCRTGRKAKERSPRQPGSSGISTLSIGPVQHQEIKIQRLLENNRGWIPLDHAAGDVQERPWQLTHQRIEERPGILHCGRLPKLDGQRSDRLALFRPGHHAKDGELSRLPKRSSTQPSLQCGDVLAMLDKRQNPSRCPVALSDHQRGALGIQTDPVGDTAYRFIQVLACTSLSHDDQFRPYRPGSVEQHAGGRPDMAQLSGRRHGLMDQRRDPCKTFLSGRNRPLLKKIS